MAQLAGFLIAFAALLWVLFPLIARRSSPSAERRAPSPAFCSACGAPLEPGANFCAECGAPAVR